jgi:NAD(P)-dependent dehydrogenase (short-subunit alcohol dehydrogenase family)
MGYRLKDKVAVVTGGASGLGYATALRFMEEGAKLIITDINKDALDIAFKAYSLTDFPDLLFQDVTDENGWKDLEKHVSNSFGKLDIMVNNAGIVYRGTVEDTTLDEWRETQSVNLDGVFMGTRFAVEMMKLKGGSIINISSIEGLVGEATCAAYNASKGGVRIFTKSAALHCAAQNYNIRVNSVHPGFMRTPMVDNALTTMPKDEVDALLTRMANEIPLGEMGDPEDIANGCLYLASDESKYVTGTELIIDGGFTCR